MRDDKAQPIPVVERQQTFSGNNRRDSRSLLERMGPPPPQRFGGNQQQPHMNNNDNFRGPPPQQQMYDPVQAQIDVVTAAQMGMGGFTMPMMTVDQMQMQEIIQSQALMLNQMNQMMQQFNTQMTAPSGGGNNAGGFNGTTQGQSSRNPEASGPGGRGRGRGSAIHGGNRGGGPGGHVNGTPTPAPATAPPTVAPSAPATNPAVPSTAVIAAPVVEPQPRTAAAAARSPLVVSHPERPGTPTLCKFSINCTNPVCRYSHPSPAATAESALVLSNDPCEKGNKCDDKDCTKSHVSPATLKPNGTRPRTKLAASTSKPNSFLIIY